ncbi:site-specific recombinase, phage integrase family [Ostertagia ostertagi]
MAVQPPKRVRPASASTTADERIAAVNKHVLPALKQYLVLKAYSAATARTYTQEVTQFLYALKNNAADSFDAERIKRYLQYCFETLHLGEHTVHSRMNALKFYYEQVLGREKFLWEIPRPKKPLQLPRFFNQEEVAAIINTTANAKHKTMLMLCYSTGMRVSEVVRLKTRNIDSKRMCILVEQAKGKKDRMAPLSPVLLVMLRAYSLAYKPSPTGYLFEGQEEGSPYSTRGLQEVLHAAKQRALVYKPGGVHSLRHSFATHLLDKGTDISMIQKLLGHNDIKTTLRYLHTTNKDIMNIRLIDSTLPFVEELLIKYGEFYPLASAVTVSDSISQVGAYNGDDKPPSDKVIMDLKTGFKAKKNDYKCVTIFYDVIVAKPDTTQKVDAVAVFAESQGDDFGCVIYFPYELTNAKELKFQDGAWKELNDKEIFVNL